jgi:transposase InsO family protein
MNTDQGAQFTGKDWIDRVKLSGAAISMDGKGRCLDNIFVERLWRWSAWSRASSSPASSSLPHQSW